MNISEIFDKLDRKKTLTLNQNAAIRVLRTAINEDSLKEEAEKRGCRVWIQDGMFVIQ